MGALRGVVLCFSLGLGSLVNAAPALSIDVKFNVRNMSMEGAKVVIVSSTGSSKILSDDLRHFTYRLDLHSDYLISFERPGCVTKQLLFDTHTPEGDAHVMGYVFPFEVTLEAPPIGQTFTYAGPVGSIRFDPAIGDFGYDTDYRTKPSEELVHQMEKAQQGSDMVVEEVAKTEVDLPLHPVEAVVGSFSPSTSSHFEEEANTVSQLAPLVHVIAMEKAVDGSLPIEVMKPAEKEIRPILESPDPIVEVTPAVQAVDRTDRTEKLEVDKLHVITTTRLSKDGRTDEYRRVVSYYGGTTHFKNGRACSESTYLQGVGR